MLDSICARSNLEQESDSPCVFTLHHLTCLSESHKSGILPCVAFCMHVTPVTLRSTDPVYLLSIMQIREQFAC